MLTRLLLTYSIFTTVLPASAEVKENTCDLIDFFDLPVCKSNALSICSTGDFFLNKVTHVEDDFQDKINIILDQRKIAQQYSQVLANKIFPTLFSKRNTLFKNISVDAWNQIINYFKWNCIKLPPSWGLFKYPPDARIQRPFVESGKILFK